MKQLNLDNPSDARIFIKEAISAVTEELVGGKVEVLHLADGTKKNVNDLSDSEAVQYAYELLPIYQARHPNLVEMIYMQ